MDKDFTQHFSKTYREVIAHMDENYVGYLISNYADSFEKISALLNGDRHNQIYKSLREQYRTSITKSKGGRYANWEERLDLVNAYLEEIKSKDELIYEHLKTFVLLYVSEYKNLTKKERAKGVANLLIQKLSHHYIGDNSLEFSDRDSAYLPLKTPVSDIVQVYNDSKSSRTRTKSSIFKKGIGIIIAATLFGASISGYVDAKYLHKDKTYLSNNQKIEEIYDPVKVSDKVKDEVSNRLKKVSFNPEYAPQVDKQKEIRKKKVETYKMKMKQKKSYYEKIMETAQGGNGVYWVNHNLAEHSLWTANGNFIISPKLVKKLGKDVEKLNLAVTDQYAGIYTKYDVDGDGKPDTVWFASVKLSKEPADVSESFKSLVKEQQKEAQQPVYKKAIKKAQNSLKKVYKTLTRQEPEIKALNIAYEYVDVLDGKDDGRLYGQEIKINEDGSLNIDGTVKYNNATWKWETTEIGKKLEEFGFDHEVKTEGAERYDIYTLYGIKVIDESPNYQGTVIEKEDGKVKVPSWSY